MAKKRKRDWLSREHRLRVAGLAIEWLHAEQVDPARFARACVAIEGYLAYGGEQACKMYDIVPPAKPALVVPFKKADP